MSANDGPPRPAGDAVSLHTIADDQIYEISQEQEDADFALALALEDQESETLRQQQQDRDRNVASGAAGVEQDAAANATPYRTDLESGQPGTIEDLPRYRDDPEAPDDDEEIPSTQPAPATARSWHPGRYLRSVASKWKSLSAWLPKLKLGTIITLTCVLLFFGGVAWALIIVFEKVNPSSKEIAFENSGSSNYRLKLPRLYPQLEAGTDEKCISTWEEHAESLYCQEQILTSAWDHGDAKKIKQTLNDPWAYSGWVCLSSCRSELRGLETALGHHCNRRTHRFDIDSYKKMKHRYFELDEIPEGPLQLARSLGARYDSLCHSTTRRQIPWGTYTAQLWMRWGILDGKDAATNLDNLKIFWDATRERKTIEGGNKTGSIYIGGPLKESKNYDVEEPARNIGPGAGETDCGYAILSWLERMMRSFEYGAIMNPVTGQAFGLEEWNNMMEDAILRCETREAKQVLRRVHTTWERFGWWCNGKTCREDDPKVDEVVRKLLHGMDQEDWPLPDIRKQMAQRDAPKSALQALHDGSLSLPCYVWIGTFTIEHIVIPFDFQVHTLCSDRCRNAVDKMQQQHGAEFAQAAKTLPDGNIFEAWESVLRQTNKTCAGAGYNEIVTATTCFHAPGYAALGHPSWTMQSKKPSRLELLSAYGPALDNLTAQLPWQVEKPAQDDYSGRRLARIMSESACNACLGQKLIGRNPKWKDTVDEYLDDESIDGKEYVRVAKMFFTTCTEMAGHRLTWREKEKAWEITGLDRFDH